ncbi:hypothetical protein [Streptomyces sp. NPDC049879]|uniref:hypothetical protein n=1 Tax=Streptomyces sp. NPDC049879 TaxID=3365598 RepID=UPI00379364BD
MLTQTPIATLPPDLTPADRRTWLNRLADTALDSLLTSEVAWHRLLWTAGMHPSRPTITNLAVIAEQAPFCFVDNYKGWQRRGQQVQEGEKGLLIYRSILRRSKNATSDDGGRLHGFLTGKLWTHAQVKPTDPEAPDPQTAPYAQTWQTTADQLRDALTDLPTLTACPPDAEMTEEHCDAILDGMLTLAQRHGLADKAAQYSAVWLASYALDGPLPDPPPMPRLPADAADLTDPKRRVLIQAQAQAVIDTGRAIAQALHRP